MEVKIPSVEILEEEITLRSGTLWFGYTQIFAGVWIALDCIFSDNPMVVAISRESGIFIFMAYAWAVSWLMTQELSYQKGYTDRIRAEIKWVKTGNTSNLYS